MDNAFELAFNLIDEALARLHNQQLGITRILFHNFGALLLTTVHDYSPIYGHRLVLIAADDDGIMATLSAAAFDLSVDKPEVRITKVRAGELEFKVDPHHQWTFRATRGDDIYTLTALIPHEDGDPGWTTQFNDDEVLDWDWDDLNDAVSDLLNSVSAAKTA